MIKCINIRGWKAGGTGGQRLVDCQINDAGHAGPLCASPSFRAVPNSGFAIIFKKYIFIYLILEREEGREKEKERNINVRE